MPAVADFSEVALKRQHVRHKTQGIKKSPDTTSSMTQGLFEILVVLRSLIYPLLHTCELIRVDRLGIEGHLRSDSAIESFDQQAVAACPCDDEARLMASQVVIGWTG